MPRPTLRAPLIALALLALGAAGGATATASLLRADAPTRTILAQRVDPQGAPDRTLLMQRVVIPAGLRLGAHTHQGDQMAEITTGTLRYTVIAGRPVRVVRPTADGAPVLVRLIRPGQTYDVRAGLAVVEPAGSAHRVRALPGDDVVIYVASLFREGAPLSDPYPPESE
jgi:quercetin dioxygenase-like cupin family protein